MGNKFGGFGGGMGNMQAMMRQAQKMQQDAMKAKEEIENSEFEGVASNGLVKITINGSFEMLAVKIDPSIVDADDTEMLEDLIVVAFNDAKAKADKMKGDKLGAFGGLI